MSILSCAAVAGGAVVLLLGADIAWASLSIIIGLALPGQ